MWSVLQPFSKKKLFRKPLLPPLQCTTRYECMGKHSRSGFELRGKNVRGGVAEKPYSLAIPAFLERNPLLHPFSTTLPLIDPLYFLPPTLGFWSSRKKGGRFSFAYFPAQIYKNACGSLKLRFRFSLSFSAISPDLFLCQTACFPRAGCGMLVGVLTCKNRGIFFANMYLNRHCADLKN